MDPDFIDLKMETMASLENARNKSENSKDIFGALASVITTTGIGLVASNPNKLTILVLGTATIACGAGMAIKSLVENIKQKRYEDVQFKLLKKEYQNLLDTYANNHDANIEKAKDIAKMGPTSTRDLNL